MQQWEMEKPLEHFNEIINRLTERMRQPLPGWAAQQKMASMRRLGQGSMSYEREKARRGCVLVLLYPIEGQMHTVFIQRNEYEGIHSGQISFPGGQAEEADHTHADTALREAWEETGIRPDKVTILGELSELYIPPSNFLVSPVVGYTLERPDFIPDPAEVRAILEVNLAVLKDPGIIQIKKIELPDGFFLSAPCYSPDGYTIWGATAMIVSELLEVI